MHTLPTDHLPYAVLAIAIAIYFLIQALKTRAPGLCGRHALLLNGVLAAVGVILTEGLKDPKEILSMQTLSAILTVTGVAAGIHGTVSKLGGAPASCDDAPRPSNVFSAGIAVLALALLLPLSGCKEVKATPPAPLPVSAANQLDFSSNQALQAAHGFAARVSADVLDGKLKLTPTQTTILSRLNASLNVADALEISYHRCAIVQGAQPSQATCDTTSLISAVAAVQQAFGNTELALVPAKK